MPHHSRRETVADAVLRLARGETPFDGMVTIYADGSGRARSAGAVLSRAALAADIGDAQHVGGTRRAERHAARVTTMRWPGWAKPSRKAMCLRDPTDRRDRVRPRSPRSAGPVTSARRRAVALDWRQHDDRQQRLLARRAQSRRTRSWSSRRWPPPSACTATECAAALIASAAGRSRVCCAEHR